MTIKDYLCRGAIWAYRKMYIKRLQLDGTYESEWLEITEYVKSFGVIMKSFGDQVLLSNYQIDDMTIVLENSRRTFNKETDYNSIFFGYKTRYRTKFKIESGVYDDDDTEIPGVVWYGVLFSDPVTNDQGQISIQLASTLKMFQYYKATGISTLSGTTAELVDRLANKTQNGISIFNQFFEGFLINPSSATCMTISSPLITADQSVWDKIVQYSIYQDYFAYVDNNGYFVWDSKSPTDDVQWVFNGAGSNDADYAVTIMSVDRETEGIPNTFTRCVIEYAQDQFVESALDWTPGDGSFIDIYGEKTLPAMRFFELTQSEAQEVADRITDIYAGNKREWDISAGYIPHLIQKDKVTINFVGELSVKNPFIIGVSKLGGTDQLAGYTNSINLSNQAAKIVAQRIDLDGLKSWFLLKEI